MGVVFAGVAFTHELHPIRRKMKGIYICRYIYIFFFLRVWIAKKRARASIDLRAHARNIHSPLFVFFFFYIDFYMVDVYMWSFIHFPLNAIYTRIIISLFFSGPRTHLSTLEGEIHTRSTYKRGMKSYGVARLYVKAFRELTFTLLHLCIYINLVCVCEYIFILTRNFPLPFLPFFFILYHPFLYFSLLFFICFFLYLMNVSLRDLKIVICFFFFG